MLKIFCMETTSLSDFIERISLIGTSFCVRSPSPDLDGKREV